MNKTNVCFDNLTAQDINSTCENGTLEDNDINSVTLKLSAYILYGIIAISIVGLTGNVFALIVVLKERLTSISLLLCSIFISDCLILLGLLFFSAFDILNLIHERSAVILYLEFFIGIGNAFAAMVGVERSIAIMHPIQYRLFWKKRYTQLITSMIILLNLSFEVVRQYYFFRRRVMDDPYFRIVEQILRRYFPLVCLTTTNACMAVGLRRILRRRAKMFQDSKKMKNTIDIDVTKTSFIIVLSNFVCNTPGTVTILLVDMGIYTEVQVSLFLQLAMTLHTCDATMNFIVYALFSRNYRNLFKSFICCSPLAKKPESGATEDEMRKKDGELCTVERTARF